MAKYMLLKHARRDTPALADDVPMTQWTPEEVSTHVQYTRNFVARLEDTGEFVDAGTLSPQATFVRYTGEGQPPVTDDALTETTDLIAEWYIVDVDSSDRAVELAAELSAAPGPGGNPIHEWLQIQLLLAAHPPTVTEWL